MSGRKKNKKPDTPANPISAESRADIKIIMHALSRAGLNNLQWAGATNAVFRIERRLAAEREVSDSLVKALQYYIVEGCECSNCSHGNAALAEYRRRAK